VPVPTPPEPPPQVETEQRGRKREVALSSRDPTPQASRSRERDHSAPEEMQVEAAVGESVDDSATRLPSEISRSSGKFSKPVRDKCFRPALGILINNGIRF
jgi:hypothetical protein